MFTVSHLIKNAAAIVLAAVMALSALPLALFAEETPAADAPQAPAVTANGTQTDESDENAAETPVGSAENGEKTDETASADNGETAESKESTAENAEETAKKAEEPEKTPIVFSDIADDAPYKNAVYKLVDAGVLNGYPDGTFQPMGKLTRAEMCKMINLTFGYTDIEGAAGFPDLVPDEWYIPYVLAAQKAGYVKGDGDTGFFRPDDDISREEVCIILARIIEPYDLPLPVTITDKVDDWAKTEVELIVKNYIMPLEEGGAFRATEPIKRFELAEAVAPQLAEIEKQTCTVTFMNGETAEGTVTIDIGARLETLPTPAAIPEGHTFRGWSTEKEEYVTEYGTVYTGDTTLYAFFDKIAYRVRFLVDNTIILSDQQVLYGGYAAKPADPALKGYTFAGWAVGDSKSVVNLAAYPITASTTFHAVFASIGGAIPGGSGGPAIPETKYYTVVFYNGDTVVKQQSVAKGKTASAPSAPKKEGYTFLYWSKSEGGAEVTVSSVTINADTDFYAVFKKDEQKPDDDEDEPKTYTVRFEADGRTHDTQTVTEGKSPALPDDPEKDGYTFKYWSDEKDGEATDPASAVIKANKTFYAVFEKEPELIVKFKVTFISDGSTVNEQEVVRGETAKAPKDPAMPGYEFMYWSTEEEGDEVVVGEYEINAETTFYAVYQLKNENPNDPELIAAIRKTLAQFKTFTPGANKYKQEAKKIIVRTMTEVLERAENGELVTKDAVRKQWYAEEVARVYEILTKELSESDASKFVTDIESTLDPDALDVLVDFFVSESTKEKYFGRRS